MLCARLGFLNNQLADIHYLGKNIIAVLKPAILQHIPSRRPADFLGYHLLHPHFGLISDYGHTGEISKSQNFSGWQKKYNNSDNDE